ncbi:defensin beta 136 [Pteronotus mesoamericanus]|uniref:defensin beta 136 n=1 Tax=Pteronotus mesoamericanus TaxID=1884717 RepID=UPI0023ED080D|nr:defensin beta 136 [Pteronotus parnellii mesoamericanus]
MRLCLSGLLFLLVILLPPGNCLFGNDGVEVQACNDIGGRCFLGCKIGWKWVSFCYSVLSCCTEIKKNQPPQVREY